MSSETSAWAKEQRCGDPVTKAVLREIANWAKPTGVCEFLSVKRIAEVTEVSVRTVQRHIARLEDNDPAAGGLGLIRRVVRHRDDGGQGANSFELIGYQPPPSTGAQPRRQSVTPPRQNDTGPRHDDAQPRDNGDARLGDKIIPPSSSDEDEAPTADLLDGLGERAEPEAPVQPAKAHRLPDGWTAPAVDDLPPIARDLVRQWPSGAYQATCETFRLHWLGEHRAIGRKTDWLAALGKWLIKDHSQVMRDAKAGVSFAKLAPASAAAVKKSAPVKAKDRETDRSAAIHELLSKKIGRRLYEQWIEPCAIIASRTGVDIVCPTEFLRGYVDSNFGSEIGIAVRQAIGSEANDLLRWEVERAANNQHRSA
jgi:hypothetical protein